MFKEVTFNHILLLDKTQHFYVRWERTLNDTSLILMDLCRINEDNLLEFFSEEGEGQWSLWRILDNIKKEDPRFRFYLLVEN